MAELSNIEAIKQFFGGVRPVANTEIMVLTKEERQWFGDECRKALAAQ